jgi:hypothetical protein
MSSIITRMPVFVLCLAPVATACVGVAPDEEAMTDQSSEDASATLPFTVSTCLTQAANATMTLGPNAQGNYWGSVSSDGTGYTAGGCSSFIVDVIAPGGYDPPLIGNAFRIGVRHEGVTLTEDNCDSAYESVHIYRRSSNVVFGTTSEFKPVASETAHSGVWETGPDINPHCELTNDEGFRFEAPTSFLVRHTYRVLLTSKLDGESTAASVGWGSVY